ncbi:pirin family protein [Chitinophaga oryziterrae]|uniref:Pirin family protein n=1 Tax=Chitinophaga oryziterrae TaxID=1031224 RepID=A0A6N8J3J0_9BACT|nr:pirin family protein [Chitinophaga oryziterrae]MVT39258.1 pirin family protein [Chitinophaga oryziterrae]
MQKTVNKIINNHPVSGSLKSYHFFNALPMKNGDTIDPFLLLHHHGPMNLPPQNSGMPFGPHPHRGFETVTWIVSGHLVHKDSHGFHSKIEEGGVQWMTAGRGLIHNEFVEQSFKENGGELELLQLWINLPAKLKMQQPHYTGLQKKDIPVITSVDGKSEVAVAGGNWNGNKGAVNSLTGINAFLIKVKEGGNVDIAVEETRNVLFYVLRGNVTVNGAAAGDRSLVLFNNGGDAINIKASSDAIILYCDGLPLNEPVAWHGPYVMNTQTEIMEAMRDERMGKFGFYID